MNGNNQSPVGLATGKKGWMWPVIVLVVIVVLLAAYYVFYYGYTPASSGGSAELNDFGRSGRAIGGAIGGVSENETAAIEKDLQSTTVDGLGSELDAIEKEIGK